MSEAMQAHHLRARIAVAAVIWLAALGGISAATAADDDQQYTGCLKNGTLSNVAIGTAPSARCPTGANQITWSEQGTQGEPGIQGEQGPQGEQGLAGTPGTDAWFVADDGAVAEGSGGYRVSMTLPAGSYVIEARATLRNRESALAEALCELPGGPLAHTYLGGAGQVDSEAVIELTTAINHPGGALEVLGCVLVDSGPFRIGAITVLATPVGSVLAG